MLGLWFSRYLVPYLTVGITIPLWLIAAVALWVHFDRSSAVRTAVDRAVVQLVAGAEIEAANAKAEGQHRLRLLAEGAAEEARRRAQALEDANRRHAVALAAAETEKEELVHEIEDLLSNPVDDACVVSRDVLDRLRNR